MPQSRPAVRDNGPGIPDDKKDLVLAAFGRAHDDPGRTESVGPGLAVSRNLARMMDGDVIYRRLGAWTSFELHLPLGASALQPSESEAADLAAHIARHHGERTRYARSRRRLPGRSRTFPQTH